MVGLIYVNKSLNGFRIMYVDNSLNGFEKGLLLSALDHYGISMILLAGCWKEIVGSGFSYLCWMLERNRWI